MVVIEWNLNEHGRKLNAGYMRPCGIFEIKREEISETRQVSNEWVKNWCWIKVSLINLFGGGIVNTSETVKCMEDVQTKQSIIRRGQGSIEDGRYSDYG